MAQQIPVSKKVAEKDRHSRTSVSGSPKKGGAGGKGTWGVGGKDDLIATNLDPQDPNYLSDEEGNVVLDQVVVANPIETMIHEFFLCGEMDEARKSLVEYGKQYDHFVKKALRLGMEKQAYERELVSKLLVAVYNNPVTPDEIQSGFLAALKSLPDFKLDSPEASEILGKFLGRAVFDEIVPPAFLKSTTTNDLAEEAITFASVLVNEKHRGDRLAHIWGPGDLTSVKRLKEESKLLFDEYLLTGDTQEAERSIRKLNAPSFHAQLIKQGLREAIYQKNEEASKKVSKLLGLLNQSGLVSTYHLQKGFQFCHEIVSDIALDVPNAQVQLAKLVELGIADGYLPADFKM